MYLSRLVLNPASRQVQNELANVYELHRTVMKAFAGRLENDERVLFRLEGDPFAGIPMLLIQSVHQPDWSFLQAPGKNYLAAHAGSIATKPIGLSLKIGQHLAFRLTANPTVKRDNRRFGIFSEDQQLAWLKRKLESAGAEIVNAAVTSQSKVTGNIPSERVNSCLTFSGAQFDGILEVISPKILEIAIRNGIGPAKGFGFGLLSIAQAY